MAADAASAASIARSMRTACRCLISATCSRSRVSVSLTSGCSAKFRPNWLAPISLAGTCPTPVTSRSKSLPGFGSQPSIGFQGRRHLRQIDCRRFARPGTVLDRHPNFGRQPVERAVVAGIRLAKQHDDPVVQRVDEAAETAAFIKCAGADFGDLGGRSVDRRDPPGDLRDEFRRAAGGFVQRLRRRDLCIDR